MSYISDTIKQLIIERSSYGNSFPKIASLWQKYLEEPIQSKDVARMLSKMKVVRYIHLKKTGGNLSDTRKDFLAYKWIWKNYEEYLGLISPRIIQGKPDKGKAR